MPLTIAGEHVEPGLYYLTVTHQGDEMLAMHLLDSNKIRAQRPNCGSAVQTTGGIEVLFEHEEMGEAEKKLKIMLKTTPGERLKSSFIVRFGPHQLTLPIEAHLD